MKKPRKAQVEALEERAARLLRKRAVLIPDDGPLPSDIVRARLAALAPRQPQTREQFDACTELMRRDVAKASGANRAVLANLLRLRIAHGPA